MAQLERIDGMLFMANPLVPQGKQLLWRNGAPVVCIALNAPVQDYAFDRIDLNPVDCDELRQHRESSI